MKIYIDGDGCPVIKNTIKVAKCFNVPVVIVKNYNHNIVSDYAKVISVDASSDRADFCIANLLTRDDLVITGDYGLAAMVLSKNSYVITPFGNEITSDNLPTYLTNRYFTQVQKKQHKKIKSKRAKRCLRDDEVYENKLAILLNKILER